ncbi:hypothetical protein [Halosegnis rubeus]|uniref:Uncharacterized protein n=1 Tax=Halosegnis rubeus TaxID=2212850 RepID=A0A5N5UKU8_9EURY|nr:hypothetical protein [Halosegnis rubeus]KAB7519443.1 hypothetical protein DP108_04895 [Halosegnis rubeus]
MVNSKRIFARVNTMKREFRHMAYRGLQELRGGTNISHIDSVLFYPTIKFERQKEDLLNRLAWYIPENPREGDFTVFIPLNHESMIKSELRTSPQACYNYQHFNLEFISTENIHSVADQVDLILNWDSKYQFSPKILKSLSKTMIVDPQYFSAVEIDRWLQLSNYAEIDEENNSISSFRKLENDYRDCDTAFVFARGPSLKHAYDYELGDDSISIICNGIVRDRELLDHIDPDILTAADPILFSPSKYGHKFRQDAADAMESYEMATIIPPKYHALVNNHFSGLDFITIPSIESEKPIFPTSDNLKVRATANIMTLFMLPIASSIADEVYIIGADGMDDPKSGSFDHYEATRYNPELVKSATECHPSYYRDNKFSSYYEDHLDTMRDIIEYGEQQGIEYYSLTDSNIPCLAERVKRDIH